MPQELTQQQEERLVQVAGAQQVALARLIELSVDDMRQRVEEEMVANEALEEHDDDLDDGYGDDEPGQEGEGADDTDDEVRELDGNMDESMGSDDELSDYLTDDDVPTYLRERKDAEREQRESPLTYASSFYEELTRQIGERDLTDHEAEVLEYIIGSLDESGFLRKSPQVLEDELMVYQDVETTTEEIERLVGVLQTFEPRGVGARSLQECLELQLQDEEQRSPLQPLALDVVRNHFKDFTSRHWDALQQSLHVDRETFEGVMALLTHLNPAPGQALSEGVATSAPAITPDFFLEVADDDSIHVYLNHEDIPELRVSPAFRATVKQYVGRTKQLNREQSDAYIYARQKVQAAQSFIDLISRRNQTLRAVMESIARRQRAFFLGDEDETQLRPMKLEQLSTEIGIDISTVSRVTTSKYVQTARAIYPLKFFFSNETVREDGETISTREVKVALREIIESEDKAHPLSDNALVDRLRERGYTVARRTVAKYRDQLGLPVARLRVNLS